MVMDRRLCCVLALVLAAICTAQALTSEQCNVDSKARTDCGFRGIPQADCNSRGCCFDSSIPEVIWCFYPKAPEVCF
ncbi:trefoil factor 3-like [Eleutherodactylus coqui]|uniref:P-type domain-containing protein n=1 Tax=Eleutherodactylus coqui TaxID=57060 RepID=A0A8J6ECR0_ELECQ|nr:hypothetical protein GDO78_017311 [Eleutherodactylus coqui]